MSKFNLVPSTHPLEYLKKLSETFIGNNILAIATLLQSCGSYLLHTPDVAQKFNSLLDLIWRLKEKESHPHNLI